MLWPLDSASSEYGLVRPFDHLSRDASSQLSKIASAEEMPRATRHLPAWPRFENPWNPRKLFPPTWANFGGQIIKVFWVLGQNSKCVHALWRFVRFRWESIITFIWCFMICITSSYIIYEYLWGPFGKDLCMKAFGERISVWRPLEV